MTDFRASRGFEEVLRMVERTTDALVDELTRVPGLS